MKTISFYTLGCRLNQAETAVLQQQFEQSGFHIVDVREPADVVVINTCTVTEHGDTDTRRVVNRVRRLNADARIALIGCQAQVQSKQLAQMPGVRWVVGNGVKMDLPQLLLEPEPKTPLIMVPAIKRESFTMPGTGIDREHTRANLKIQDGCDFYCSFCEIPYARGRARSRQFNDLLREARELAAAGYRELVLTGINVGMYKFEDKNIAHVVHELETLDLLRIRISSIEPTTIPDSLLQRMNHGKLCRYLHMPLQNGSDAILRAMGRKYDVAEFDAFIRGAVRQVPDICIGTDIMVGFPGETDAQFEETLAYVRQAPLAYFHVFSYSDRPHGKSRKLETKVARQVIDRRSKIMRDCSLQKRRAYFERFIGQTVQVLFEEQKNSLWAGLTDTYIRVRVPSALDLHNQDMAVKLIDLEPNTMLGTLV